MENSTALTPALRPRFNNVGVSMVKNEEDIIEAFVRYNLRFLDHILVVDNGSSDSTLLILKKMRACPWILPLMPARPFCKAK